MIDSVGSLDKRKTSTGINIESSCSKSIYHGYVFYFLYQQTTLGRGLEKSRNISTDFHNTDNSVRSKLFLKLYNEVIIYINHVME